MKRVIMTGAVLVAALFSFTVDAAMHWAPAPKVKGSGHGAHGSHDRSAGKGFVLVEGEGAALTLISPKLTERSLHAEHGRVTVKPTGMGNYHALVATRSLGDLQESAIRYHYMHGKPPRTSPSLLIGHEKSALEIKPAPLAREHWRYYANSDAYFLLSFRGKPLVGANVKMMTGNGSSYEFNTDAEGKVRIPLPEDFTNIKAGRSHNRPSEFVLTAVHEEGGKRFVTTFSSDYHVNPEQWQSTPLGVAVIGGGMLLGGLITWRARRRKEK